MSSRRYIRTGDSLHVANVVEPCEMSALGIAKAETTAEFSCTALLSDVGTVEIAVHRPFNLPVVTILPILG